MLVIFHESIVSWQGRLQKIKNALRKTNTTPCCLPTHRRDITRRADTTNFAKKAVALTYLRTIRCCSNATSHNSPLRCPTARCHVHRTLHNTPLCQRKYAQLVVTQHAHTYKTLHNLPSNHSYIFISSYQGHSDFHFLLLVNFSRRLSIISYQNLLIVCPWRQCCKIFNFFPNSSGSIQLKNIFG